MGREEGRGLCFCWFHLETVSCHAARAGITGLYHYAELEDSTLDTGKEKLRSQSGETGDWVAFQRKSRLEMCSWVTLNHVFENYFYNIVSLVYRKKINYLYNLTKITSFSSSFPPSSWPFLSSFSFLSSFFSFNIGLLYPWPRTHYVVKDYSEFPILLLLPLCTRIMGASYLVQC